MHADLCPDTRRVLRATPAFLRLFEYRAPCDLRSLRQLHGPLTRADALRDAVLAFSSSPKKPTSTKKEGRFVDVLYTCQTMRPVALMLDLAPSPEEASVRLTCTPITALAMLQQDPPTKPSL